MARPAEALTAVTIAHIEIPSEHPDISLFELMHAAHVLQLLHPLRPLLLSSPRLDMRIEYAHAALCDSEVAL